MFSWILISVFTYLLYCVFIYLFVSVWGPMDIQEGVAVVGLTVGRAAVWAAGHWASQTSQPSTLLSTNWYFIKHKSLGCLFLMLMQLLPYFVLPMNFVCVLQWNMYLFLAANSHAILFLVCAHLPLLLSSSPPWYLGQYHLICSLLSVLESFHTRAF